MGPCTSHSALWAMPTPGIPMVVEASRHTHSPTAGRCRCTERSGFPLGKYPWSSAPVPDGGKRGSIYARISGNGDEGHLGADWQVADCRRLCKDRGWRLTEARIYVDDNVSASSGTRSRPEYRRLLADVGAGRVDAVAVWDLDRLTRRPIELEQFVQACSAAGVTELATVSGTVDVGTGDGMLVARIKGAVAAEEARKIGQRVARKHLELAEAGMPSTGGRAFGFEQDMVTVRGD
jgi:site-specific DNA recombinase